MFAFKKEKVEQKIAMGFAAAILFMCAIGVTAWWTEHQNADALRSVDHTHQVFSQLERTFSFILDAETESRGYVISGSEAFLEAYRKGVASAWRSFAEVKRLTSDNPDQRRRMTVLEPLLQKRLALADELVELRSRGESVAANQRISTGQGKRMTSAIRALINEIAYEERALLEKRSARARNMSRATLAVVSVGGVLSVLLVGLAGFLVRRDLRRRQQAEEERDRFFDLSLDMLCVSNADGYFKQVNRAFTQTLGWSKEALLSRPFTDFVHPDDLAVTLAAVERQVVAGENILFFDNRYRHKDGSWRVLSWRSVPYPGGFMIATARDVTEFRQMEQALRRSEESLSVTLNSIGDAVLATDTGERITMMNPVAEKLTGWRATEALGRPIAEVFQIIAETTRLPAVIPVEDVLATGSVHGLANHTVLIARDGTECPIADSAAPIRDRQGAVLGVVLVFRDVTEERRAQRRVEENEGRFRALAEKLERCVEERTSELRDSERLAQIALDALSAHVAILDGRGVIIATNQPWREFASRNGLPSEQIGVGTNYLDVCDTYASVEESSAQMAQAIRDVIGGNRPQFVSEYAFRSNGEQRWFIVRVTRSPGAGPVRVVVAHENITSMKLREREIFRAQRLESIGTLAGGVAHDLNNALAPILMSLELLREQYPREIELLDTLKASAKRGSEMVKQLLTFAKGAEGDKVPVDMGLLLREMRNIIRGTFPKNILLEVRSDAPLPKVRGDATQLHQILLNLAVNARDAMPAGGTLTLEARRVDLDDAEAGCISGARPGTYVVVRVNDTGTGIPPEMIDRIFDPFFTTKAPDVGTGLGLSTVMGIVKGHNGFLTVETHHGQGSSFNIYLPADPADDNRGSPPKREKAFSGKGEVILFVDDEVALRNVARAVFRKLGFEVVLAADGVEALTRVAERWTGLRAVITDVRMPRMDGIAFVAALRRVLPLLPVAVMSGRQDENVKTDLAKMGVKVWLDKPFNERQLTEVLKGLLAPQ